MEKRIHLAISLQNGIFIFNYNYCNNFYFSITNTEFN